jgi:ferrous iron transport protein A
MAIGPAFGKRHLLLLLCRVHKRGLYRQENTSIRSIKMPTVLLRNMNKGQAGIIQANTAGGELGRRMRDLGLVPGARITVCGRAPLHDPVAIRVMDCTLTLRNNEAEYLQVEIQ